MTAEDEQATITLAMTALAHAIEASISPAKNPLTDMYAYPAIQLISDHLVNAIKDPDDTHGRVALINAISMAGCAVSTSTFGMIHKMGQTVSRTCPVPLGLCNALHQACGYKY